MTTPKSDGERIMRYVEGEPAQGKFTLQVISGSSPTPALVGMLDAQPQWLVDIVTIAKIGGHCMAIRRPPPHRILWFALDHDNKLLRFVDITQ